MTEPRSALTPGLRTSRHVVAEVRAGKDAETLLVTVGERVPHRLLVGRTDSVERRGRRDLRDAIGAADVAWATSTSTPSTTGREAKDIIICA